MKRIRHTWVLMAIIAALSSTVRAAPITTITPEVDAYIGVVTQVAAFVSAVDTNSVESVITNFFEVEAALFDVLDVAVDRIQGFAEDSGAVSTNLLPITEQLMDVTSTTRFISPQIGFWQVQTDIPTQTNLLAMIEEAVADLQEARADVNEVLASIAGVTLPPILSLRLLTPEETVMGASIPVAAEMSNTGDTEAENIRLIATYGFYPEQEETEVQLGNLPAGERQNHLFFVPAPVTSNSAVMVSVTLEADNAAAALDTTFILLNEP